MSMCVLISAGQICLSCIFPVQITSIVSVSVSIAMYCLIQLYIPVAAHLAPHKPILKLFAVKSVGMSLWYPKVVFG